MLPFILILQILHGFYNMNGESAKRESTGLDLLFYKVDMYNLTRSLLKLTTFPILGRHSDKSKYYFRTDK